MNLRHFLTLCVFFTDTVFRVLEAKPAKSNGLAKLSSSTQDFFKPTQFSVSRRTLKPITTTDGDIDDDEHYDDDSKESQENNDQDDAINGIMTEVPKDLNDEQMIKMIPRVKRATTSGKNSSNIKVKTTKAPPTVPPKDESLAAIDEAMSKDSNVTTTTTKPGKPGKPPKKKSRRHDEVSEWPTALPFAELSVGEEEEIVHKFVGSEDGGDTSINSEGGLISTGKIGTSSEEAASDENKTSDSTDSSNKDTTGNEMEEEHATITYAPELDSQDNMASNNTDKQKNDKSKTGSKSTNKPPGQRDISGSSSNVIKKPGKCRPLTSGLACIALSPDASQCSTDNSCPSSKKCCFYGCAPYKGIGICEFPVLN